MFGVRYIGGRWREILPALQQAQVWLLLGVIAVVVLIVVLHRRRARPRPQEPTP